MQGMEIKIHLKASIQGVKSLGGGIQTRPGYHLLEQNFDLGPVTEPLQDPFSSSVKHGYWPCRPPGVRGTVHVYMEF